jgi:DNA-binding XRE family transcriptional regulator
LAKRRKQCKKKITTIVTGRKIALWPTLLRLKRSPSLQLLGERIRQARKVKGLSQEDLALASNTAPSYIGGVERGQRNPSFKKLCAIAKIIGRDVGSLCRNLPLPDEPF